MASFVAVLALAARVWAAPPLECTPVPAGTCEPFEAGGIDTLFKASFDKLSLSPRPDVVVDPSHEFVSFDCAAGKPVAGPFNAVTQGCPGRHVVTVGRSLADMSIPCRDLGVTKEQTMEAWALHEGAHVKLDHVACRRLDLERVCTAWASQAAGRATITRLLTRYGAASLDALDPARRDDFRGRYVDACVAANRDRLESRMREQEDEADKLAAGKAAPNALLCAMKGAIAYLETIGAEEDTRHRSTKDRALDAETRAASQVPSIRLPDGGDALSR